MAKPEQPVYGDPTVRYECRWCRGTVKWMVDHWQCDACTRKFKDPTHQGNPAWKGPHGNAIKPPAGGKDPAQVPAPSASDPRDSGRHAVPAPLKFPPLPAWSDKWHHATQVAWLEVWGGLFLQMLESPENNHAPAPGAGVEGPGRQIP